MPRILKDFRLDEISAVDYPAQTPARAVIMKRDFNAEQRQHAADSGAAMPDGSFPIENGSDLENAIRAIGRAKDPEAAKAHIKARAKSLGMTDKLPDNWVAKRKEADEVADIAEITKRAEAAEAKVVELTKQAEELAKRADDEILKVGETEIRKSAVGAEMFAFAKAQNDALTKAREEAELSTLAKRASAEFGSLPGTDILKAKILKAASAMPEEVAKALTEALAAGNAAIKLGFEKAGMGSGAPAGSAQDEINTLAKARAAKDGISFAKASVLVMDENPELYKRADAEHAARVKGA